MKPAPAPNVPGRTDAQRFDAAVRAMFRVSKVGLLKAEAKEKCAKERKAEKKSS